jgi:sigma-B regulation protein RsbU (phosphoserine phosphatase)
MNNEVIVPANLPTMKVEDLSHNLKLASLKKLTRSLKQSLTPDETLRALHRGFTETGGFAASMLLSTRGLSQGEYRVLRMHLTSDPQANVLASAAVEGGPVKSGGIVAAITGHSEPQLIQDVDWSHDPFFHDALQGYTSVIALPISADRLPMNWSLLLKRAPERFTVADLEHAVERAALASAVLENQILAADLARANQQIDREARQMGELQRALLPASLPRIARLEVAASYEPLGRAGGDLYDLFPLDERHHARANNPSRWCVFIGDTAGHGWAAAVVIAIVQAVMHAHPAGIARPASLLMHANRQLCNKGLGGFVTAFLGIYEPGRRRLTYANAGHPPPLLRRSLGTPIVALEEVGSYPLGIEHSETFKEAAVELEPGDTLLLYTDGVTEARDEHGDLFGEHRLRRVFQDAWEEPAEIIERLRAAVTAHERFQHSHDDQTLVAVRVL